MNKIQRISTFFKWLFLIIGVALPILSIILWINPPTSITTAHHALVMRDIPKSIQILILHPLSSTTKLLGFVISLIPLTVNLFLLYFLIRLFQLYEKCEIFSLKNVRYIKCIGYTLFIGQLINPIYQALLSAALTWNNPHGKRMIVASLSGTNMAILLTALLIILISWIMAEGHQLAEDQKYTI